MKRKSNLALVLLLLLMEGPVSFLTSNEQDKSPPEGLYLALQIVQGWWELRSSGFSDFVWSKPLPNWKIFEGGLDSDAITYCSPSSGHETLWFASYNEAHPDYWTIHMPTLNDWTIRFSIILNGNREEKGEIIEVRFIYAFFDLHGGIYLGDKGEKKPDAP